MLQIVLLILASSSLFGLTGFLFRDEIMSERWFRPLSRLAPELADSPSIQWTQSADSRVADAERAGDID
jgi:hypothetical protein